MTSNGRRNATHGGDTRRSPIHRRHGWVVGCIAVVALVGMLAVGPPIVDPSAHAAPGDGAWEIALDKVAPDPVPSGVPSSFLLSLQCSALEAPTCDNGAVAIPFPDRIEHDIDVDPHPYITGRTIEGGVMRLTLAPNFPAGASLQVGLRFTAVNITTPNGYSASFTATVTGDNTPAVSATAAATFTATPALGVTKRLPANAPNGSRYPLDTPMRYTVLVCDTGGLGRVGMLGMESATVVDTLPTGATFIAASHDGVYDDAAGTVTWQLGTQTSFCYDTLSVDVRYDTGDVDPASTVVNTVDVSGRPIGTDDEVVASAAVDHGFGDPVAAGDFCKTATSWVSAVTTTCGSNTDAFTFLGPWAGDARELGVAGFGSEGSYLLRIDNASTMAGTVDLVDPIPCRTNSDGAIPATYTSNAPGDICTEPAFIVTGFRSTGPFPGNGFHQAIESENFPTYVTTNGEVRAFVADPATNAAGALQWLFTPQAGDVVAEIRWTGAPAPVGTGTRASIARVHGYLAADLEIGDRVTNVASRTLTVGGSALTGTAQASLVAIDETVVRVLKSANVNGTFTISAGAVSPSQSPQWNSGLVITDLLPAELQSVTLDEARYMPGPGFSSVPMPASAYQFEQIPDYQGTGRTLVRFTVPAGVTIAVHPAALQVQLAPAGGAGFPWIGSRTNTARASIPGQVIDRCTSGNGFDGGSPAATDDTDDWDGDGVTTGDNYCASSAAMTRASGGAAIQATKQVRGNLDAAYASYPKVALADPSLPGDASYRVTVRNSGGANLRDAVIYDVLPTVGDTGVSAGQIGRPRGSTFVPILTGEVTVESAPAVSWEVAYSTAPVPCRPEVGNGSATWPAGCSDAWSTTPPADLATVTALRFRQTGGLLTPDASPTNSATFSWPMSTPPDAVPGDVAWNTTATVAVNDATGTMLLASEPPKVGLTVPQTDVELSKAADRPAAAIGEEITYTVTASHGTTLVTNPDGSVSYLNGGAETTVVAPATGVVVTDVLPTGLTLVPGSVVAQQGTFDPVTGDWTVGTLDVGAGATLTYRATMTAVGSQTNRAEVTAIGVSDVDSTPGDCDTAPEDDCASVTVDNLTLGISLTKLVESTPGSGDYLDADEGTDEYGLYPSGSPVRYRFLVTNTGQTDLSDVTIADPLIPFFCDDDFDVGALAAGASTTVDCRLPIGFGVGTTLNTATVTASSVGGQIVDAENTAQLVVPTPDLIVEKTTNGAAAETPDAAVPLSVGDTVTWTYVVRNVGNDDLVEVTLTDDREPAVALDSDHCTRSSGSWGDPLAPDATITCTYTGTARDDLYANTATSTGRGVTTPILVSASDLSHYTTLVAPPPSSTIAPSTTTTDPAATTTTDPASTTTLVPVAAAATPPPMSTVPPSSGLPSTGAFVQRPMIIGAALASLGLVMLAVRDRPLLRRRR